MGTLWDVDILTWLIVGIATTFYAFLVLWFGSKYGNSFDEKFKIVSAMAAAYLAVVGAWRFLDQRQREVANDFNKTSFSLCMDAVNSTSVMANAFVMKLKGQPEDSKAVADARSKFENLYTGSLAIVDDDGVANAMDRFDRDAGHAAWYVFATKGTSDPKMDTLNDTSLSGAKLTADSLALATACRKMIQSSWNVSVVPQTVQHKLDSANIRY